MPFQNSVLAFSALILSALAGDAHSNLHQRFHSRAFAEPVVEKRGIQVNSNIALLASVSGKGVSDSPDASLPYSNRIFNNATQPVTVAFWSDGNSHLPVTVYNSNPNPPNLVINIPAGSDQTVYFSDNYQGAYAPIWSNTNIDAGGQIHEPWVEVGTTPPGGEWGSQNTIDVSFLINMNNRFTSVTTDKQCVSDWTTCSYQCNDGSASCYTASVSELIHCVSPNNNGEGSAPGPWNGGCMAESSWTTTFLGPGQ